MADRREPIYCDCHGTEVMGYRTEGKVVWFDERHGKRHFTSVITEIVETVLDKKKSSMQS